MKKISFILLLLLCIFTCTGCELFPNSNSGGNEGGDGNEGGEEIKDEFEIYDVEKSLDFKVDYENKVLTIKYDEKATEFYVFQIKIKGAEFKATVNSNGEPIIDNIVKLNGKTTMFELDINSKKGQQYFNVIILQNAKKPDVPEYKDEIKLGEWQVIYKVNEPFKGGNLIHIFEGINYKEEIIPITIDMVNGFDTKTIGDKKITINYKDKKFETSITVIKDPDIEIPDVPDKPIVETVLSMDETNKLVCSFTAIMWSRKGSGADYDEAYKAALENTTANKMYHTAFQKVGFTSEQIKTLTDIVRNKLGPAFEKQFGNGGEMSGIDFYQKMFSRELFTIYKELVSKVDEVQLFMFMPIMLNSDITIDHFKLAEVTVKGVRHTFSEIINNLKGVNDATRKAFTKQYDLGYKKTTYLGLITDKTVRYTAKSFKNVLTKLFEAKEADITNVFELAKQLYTALVDKKLDIKSAKVALKNGVNSINNILNLVSKDDLVNCIKSILNFDICVNIRQYYMNKTISDAVSALYDTVTLLTRVINKISNNDYNLIFKHLDQTYGNSGNTQESSEKPLVRALTIFTKYLMPEFHKMGTTYRNYLCTFLTEVFGEYGFKLNHFNSAIELLDKISTYEDSKITYTEIEDIINEFYQIIDSMQGGNQTNFFEFVLPGKDIDSLYNYCVNSLQLDQIIEGFNKSNIIGATFEIGANKAIIEDKYNRIELYYLVVDNSEEDRYVLVGTDDDMYKDDTIIFMQNGKEPLKDANIFDKYPDEDPNNKIDPNIKHLYFDILDTKTNVKVHREFKLDLRNIAKAEGFTTKYVGLHTVLVTLKDDIFGEFYLPVTYYVYDKTDKITKVDIYTKNDTLLSGENILDYINIDVEKNYGYLVENRNGEYFYTSRNIETIKPTPDVVKVEGFDSKKLGKQTVTIKYLDSYTYTFEITVLSVEEANKIKDIYINYQPDDKNPLRFNMNNVMVEVQTYLNGETLPVQDFYKKYANENYKISPKGDVYINYGDNEIVFIIEKDGKFLKEDIARFYIDEYHKPSDGIYEIHYFGEKVYVKDGMNEKDILYSLTDIELSLSNGEKIMVDGPEFAEKFKGQIKVDWENKYIYLYADKGSCQFDFVSDGHGGGGDKPDPQPGNGITDLKIEYQEGITFDHAPDLYEISKLIKYIFYIEDGKEFSTENPDEIYDLLKTKFKVEIIPEKYVAIVYANKKVSFDIKFNYKARIYYEMRVNFYDNVFTETPTYESLAKQIIDISVFETVNINNVAFQSSFESFVKEGGEFSVNEYNQSIDFSFPKFKASYRAYYKIIKIESSMTVTLMPDETGFIPNELLFINDPDLYQIITKISDIRIKTKGTEVYYSGYDILGALENEELKIDVDTKTKKITFKYIPDTLVNDVVIEYKLREIDYENLPNANLVFKHYNNHNDFVTFENEKFDIYSLIDKVDYISYRIDNEIGEIRDRKLIDELFRKHTQIIKEDEDCLEYKFYDSISEISCVKLTDNDIKNYRVDCFYDVPEAIIKGLSDDQIINLIFNGISIIRTNGHNTWLGGSHMKYLRKYLELIHNEDGSLTVDLKENVVTRSKCTDKGTTKVIKESEYTNGKFNEFKLKRKAFLFEGFNLADLRIYVGNLSYSYDKGGMTHSYYYQENNYNYTFELLEPAKIGTNTVVLDVNGLKRQFNIELLGNEAKKEVVTVNAWANNTAVIDGEPTIDVLLEQIGNISVYFADDSSIYLDSDFIAELEKLNIKVTFKKASEHDEITIYDIIYSGKYFESTTEVRTTDINKLKNYKINSVSYGYINNIYTEDPDFKITKTNFIDYLNPSRQFNIKISAELEGYTQDLEVNINPYQFNKYFGNCRTYIYHDLQADNIVMAKVVVIYNEENYPLELGFDLRLTNGGKFNAKPFDAKFELDVNPEGKLEFTSEPYREEILQKITKFTFIDSFNQQLVFDKTNLKDLIAMNLVSAYLRDNQIIYSVRLAKEYRVEYKVDYVIVTK